MSCYLMAVAATGDPTAPVRGRGDAASMKL